MLHQNVELRQAILIGILAAVCVMLLSSCSKGPTPEESFRAYVADWNEQNFTAMYERLATETKEQMTQEDFVERYDNIYSGIEVHNLKVEPQIPEELEPDENGEVHIPFDVSMETLAGLIQFSHEGTLIEEEREEERGWFVVWDEQMIFPQLEPGDKVRAETLKAERGEITDRNGSGLAVNGTVVSIGIVPGQLGENEPDAKSQLAEQLDISVEQIDEKLGAAWVKPDLFVPIDTLPHDDQRISKLMEIPGVTKQDVSARVYPYGEAAAHLTGYVGEINSEELEKLEDKGYSQHDVLGKSGLEQVFEERLRGEDGGVITITDEAGEQKEVLAEKQPKNGEDIQLTVDMVLQESLYEQLKGDAGTAAAIHPKTGEVLALVNSPAYDPNLFVLGLSEEQWTEWNDDPEKPLLNRFAQAYAPGSAFKPITAAIGLKTGAVDPEEERNISGMTWKADSSWGDYYVTRVTDPGKPVNLRDAFIYSDNIYFAQTALDIGEDAFLEEAKAFGIGEEIPFIYPIETSKLAGEDGIQSEIQLADTGYGQGQVTMSALHFALTYTPLVNEGNMLAPQLEMKEGEMSAQVWHEQVMSAETADLLLNNLIQVVESPNGTANDAKISGLTIAGKTGTAELKQSKDDETGKENGWFVAFDTEDPQLLIAMMVEDVKDRGGSHYPLLKVKQVMGDFLQ